MSATTYFGDVVTTGNTNIVQNFVSYGATSRFTSNILGNQSIGTSGAPFGNVFVISSNNMTMNTSTIKARTVFLSGNVVASNAYQGGNLFTSLMNVSGVSNAFSMSVNAPNMGIGTSNSLIVIPGAQTYTSLTPGPPIYAFGYYSAISADGSTIISSNSPYALVYKYDGSSWGSYQLITTSSGTSGIAYSVALSSDGTTALIGDYYANGQLGYVASFKYSGGSWVNEQQLVSSAPGGGPYIRFGWSVALSADGNTALVGAPEATGSADGWVGVYRYSGGVWSSATSLVSTAGYGASFGWCVALSSDGNTAIVGASGTYIGVYKYSGGVWSSATQISVSISGALPQVTGLSVTGDGNIVVAGFPNYYGYPYYSSETGIVGVYNYSGGSWGETFIYSSAGASARFGQSVSISPDGNTIAVGAIHAAPNSQGWAAKYTYSGGSWGSPTQLVYSTPVFPTNTYFGISIGVASGGARIMVGTQTGAGVPFVVQPSTYGNPSLLVQGNVYISNLTTTNVSAFLLNVSATMNAQTLVALEIDNVIQPVPYPTSKILTYFSPWDNFGNVVTISSDGSTMLTCANPTGSAAPTAFVYRFSGGSWVGPEMFIWPTAGPSPNGFGWSVALSANGNTALIGDPDASAAYLFRYSGGTWTADNQFGYGLGAGWAVSLSGDGNTLAVGAPIYYAIGGGFIGEGVVSIYKYDGIGWSQRIIAPPDGFKPFRPYFGWSLALSGDGNKIIVGSGNTSSQSLTGAFIFSWSGYDWFQNNFLGGPPSQTAVSLSYDGSIYAVGFPDAPLAQTGGVYTTNGYIDSLLGTGTRFGASVSLSSDGNKIIIGAPNQGPNNKGYTAAYTWSPYTGWSAPQELVYPATAPVNNYYGKSVAISGDGNLTVIGTQQRNAFSYQWLTFPYFNGPNLYITGDAWVSNIILTQNVFATTINSATLNTAILTTTGFDVGTDVSASTFEVLGNIYASNALTTTNIFASIYSTRANVQTMNATTVTVTGTTGTISSTLSVNTINVNSIYLPVSNIFNLNTSKTGGTNFGFAVSISGDGNTVIVGAHGSETATVYRYSGGVWGAPTQLVSGAPGSPAYFGYAVSLSSDGNTAVVGAPQSYISGTTNPGFGWAGVYTYSGGVWSSATELTNSTPIFPPWFGFNTNFGLAVAISGDGLTAIVGGPGNRYPAPPYIVTGYARLYTKSGGVWSAGTVLNNIGYGYYFGYSVSISSNGNSSIVGATPTTGSTGWAGVYVSSSSGTALNQPAGLSYFGRSVYISPDGNTAIVGAPFTDTNTGWAGIYKNSGDWGSATASVLIGATSGSFLGYSVSLSNDGNTAIVGSYGTSLARVYRYNGGAWYLLTTISGVAGSDFGSAVSISSTAPCRAVVGSQSISSAYFYDEIYGFSSIPTTNLYASNALSGSNLSVTNTIYYNEDLTKRSLYLQPNSLNASAIQSAISATCNASYKSYWCTSPAPAYGNVLSVSGTSNAYSGSVYLPDGRVVFVTSNCTNIGIFNPVTTAFTSVTGVPPGYNGGVLLPNGTVFFAPQSSNIGLFNPVTSTFSNTGQTLYGQSYNGVLAPEGVWLTPSKYSSSFGASQIALYNPSTNQAIYTIPTEELPRPVSVTAGSFIARGVSIAWSSGIGKFVSIENAGSSYYSSDGQTWTLSTGTTLASVDPSCYWLAVAASTGLFVATGAGGNFNAAYSSDGINWNAPSAFQNPRTINSTMVWSVLTYNSIAGYFAALGTGNIYVGTNYVVTPDGVTWYSVTSTGTLFIYTSLTTDSFGNQLAVSAGVGGAWYYAGVWSQYPPSGGGLTTLQDLGSTWNSVTYSSTLNIFVAVGSTEGASRPAAAWAPAPPGTPSWSAASPSLISVEALSEWTSVSWSPEAGMFIAVGYNTSSAAGVGAYSRDGKSWYTMNPPISSLFGNKYITWSPSLKLWAIISGSGGIAPGSGYVYLAADGYNTGSVLLPSGAIMFSPIGSANVMVFQQTYTYLVSNIVVGTDVFNGMVLSPNGNVITIPSGSNIYVINPTTGISTNVGPIAGSVTNLFRGGALLPSGNIVFSPGTSGNVGMFDPVALTYSNSIPTGTSGLAFSGATLLPSGQVVFTPYDSANVGVIDTFASVSQEFCLSPYFNKF